jgi:hypothetical protein
MTEQDIQQIKLIIQKENLSLLNLVEKGQ